MNDRRVIHVVDDEEAIRKSASFLLKTSGFSVEVYPSGLEFLKVAKHVAQGCVLLDVRMPDMDGLEVQAAMADRGIDLPVIILTGHGDISIAVQAMKAGAVDFLEKPFDKTVLLDAISRAFSRLENTSNRDLEVREAQVRIAVLTPREQEVLSGLAKGYPNKTIAYDLGVSSRTVEVHRAALMQKLGVHSLSDALRIAFAAGL